MRDAHYGKFIFIHSMPQTCEYGNATERRNKGEKNAYYTK